jgi:hypothetical protein
MIVFIYTPLALHLNVVIFAPKSYGWTFSSAGNNDEPLSHYSYEVATLQQCQFDIIIHCY